MANNIDEDPDSGLSPDAAFTIVGNETRIKILQALGAAEPVSFTELRNQVGIKQGRQFNYHLDKLVGHFIRKTDSGYELRQAGGRVVEAILAGTVTGSARLEPAVIEAPCPFCGSDIEMSYREERMLLRCPECPGNYSGIESTSAAYPTLPHGSLALYYLPPAGLQDRSRREMLDAVMSWTYGEHFTIDDGVCPRCSAKFDFSMQVCEAHDSNAVICGECNRRYGIIVRSNCVNCNHFRGHLLTDYVFYRPEVRPFFEARGHDPILPKWNDMGAYYKYDERLLNSDPFEADLTYQVNADTIRVKVNANREVTVVDQ